MDNMNWYERHQYLHHLFRNGGIRLDPFPSSWETLQPWFRIIDKDIPSDSLYALLRRASSTDIMIKSKIKESLAHFGILPKRDFNQAWVHTHPTSAVGSSSAVKEPTVKEIVDLTANALMKSFDIVTLKESDQIMIKNSVHYSFDISRLETAIIKGVEPYPKGNYDAYMKNIKIKIRNFTKISQYDFYTDPWVIVFQNGLYDTTTDIFYDSDDPKIQDLRFFYALPHDYEPDYHDCPKFRKACFKWFANPKCGFAEILISDIFEMIGYCLTMNNGLKTAFMNYGPPDVGKTQVLNIIQGIVGKKNYSMTGIKRMVKNEFGTSWLQFKILNAAGETPRKKLYDTDIFKNATGGDDEIPGEVKGGKKFKFPPYAKHCFNANHLPPIDDPNDSAFFNRFILFAFRNIFKQKKSTRKFSDEILKDSSEVQGIIHNAIKGLHRLHRRNGFREKLKANTRHVWLYESDDVYKFLYDHCIKNKSYKTPSEKVWESYNDLAENALTKSKLTIELQKHKINKKQVRAPTTQFPNKRTEMYIGIKLKEDLEDQEIEERLFKVEKIDLEETKGIDKFTVEQLEYLEDDSSEETFDELLEKIEKGIKDEKED